MEDLKKLAEEQARAEAAYKAAQEKRRAIRQALERSEREVELQMQAEIGRIVLAHADLDVTCFDYGHFEKWAIDNAGMLAGFGVEPQPLADMYERLLEYKRRRSEVEKSRQKQQKKKKGE